MLRLLRIFAARDESFDLELWRAEVDEQRVLDFCGPQVAERLRDVFVRERFAGLQFDDQDLFDKHVRVILADHRSVLVPDGDWNLLLGANALLGEPMNQGVLADLFEMAVAQEAMDRKGGLAKLIA